MFGRKRKNRNNQIQKRNEIVPVDKRELEIDSLKESNSFLKLHTDDGMIEIEVLDIIENETLNREYMVYRIKDKDDVLVSILNETENSFSLDTIEDEVEFKSLEDYLASKIQDN